MNKRTQLILTSAIVVAAMVALLFINKSRLDARTERIATKPAVVTVTGAVRKAVPLQLSSIGILRAYKEVPVVSETQGKVLKRYVDVGDYVRAGDPIVKVDTLLKYAAFTTAQTAYAKAESDLGRSKALHEQGNISNNELELAALNCRSVEAQYLVAKRQYEDADICAPISGEVAERTVDVGMMVAPGAPVATIVDVSRLKVAVSLSENVISRIKKGVRVSALVEAHPGATFGGIVNHIAPKAGESLLFSVEILISNSRQYPLKAGMTARINLSGVIAEYALQIPRVALVGSAREGKVFVVEDNIARIRSITVGREHGSDLEVVSGIVEGDLVVTVGKNTIRDGASVTILQ